MTLQAPGTNLRVAAQALGFVPAAGGDAQDSIDLPLIMGKNTTVGSVTLSINNDQELQAVYSLDAGHQDLDFTAAHMATALTAEDPPFAQFRTGYSASMALDAHGSKELSGIAYADSNANGSKGGSEATIAATIQIWQGGLKLGEFSTGSNGAFSFVVDSGTYTLKAVAINGYSTPADITRTVNNNGIANLDFGYVPISTGATPTTPPSSSTSATVKHPTLSLSPSTALVNVDRNITFVATLSESSDNLVWTSDDPSIATVSGGVVTGVASGTTWINVSAGSLSARSRITVVEYGNPIPGRFPAQWTGSGKTVTLTLPLPVVGAGTSFYVALHASISGPSASGTAWTPGYSFVETHGNWGTYSQVSVDTVPAPVNVSGYVFRDMNENGSKEKGEPGISGANITLYKADGSTRICDTSSGNDGSYSFIKLKKGSYVVKASALDTYYFTVGSDGLTANASTGDVNDLDFGFNFRSLNVKYYWDANGSAGRDSGEEAWAGNWNFSLKNKSSGAVVTETTGSDGSLLIQHLEHVTYEVTVGDKAGDAFLTSAKTVDVDLSQADGSADFGFVYRSIDASIFWDDNNNGSKDSGENVIGGGSLAFGDDSPLASGSQTWTKLKPGVYTVKATGPANHYATPYGNAVDSRPIDVTHADGSADFGFVYRSLGGKVLFDADYTGGSSAGDKALKSFSVSVGTSSTTSAPDGSYSFTNLPPASVTVVSEDRPGYGHLSPAGIEVNLGAANSSGNNFLYGFGDMSNLKAYGFSQGYWKTNISKYLSGTTKGTQVSGATLQRYLDALKIDFSVATSLQPTSLQAALDVFTRVATSSKPIDLLNVQLLAAEFNYENGAYFGSSGAQNSGDAQLTWYFVNYGEWLQQNQPGNVAEIQRWQGIYDKYDNSHGGLFGTSPNPGL